LAFGRRSRGRFIGLLAAGTRRRVDAHGIGQRGQAANHQNIAFGHGVGHFRLVQPCRHLLLPEIEIAARELRGIGRIGHGSNYNHPLTQLQKLLPQSGKQYHISAIEAGYRARGEPSMTNAPAEKKPITIKKYANRRLYNTATSSYVTLDHLAQMVKQNEEFVVYDAKTGEDITRAVLTQIIVEEEGKGGQHLLPISFLRSLIGFYGDSLGRLLPRYLEHSMGAFTNHESQMRQYMETMLGGLFPFNPLEELNKQNLALFDSAMKMFVPFYGAQGAPGPNGATPPAAGAEGSDAAVAELQSRINAMQDQLNKLSDANKKS
jgi:polyhydroxyalkanoate synthesis repressor PhaR